MARPSPWLFLVGFASACRLEPETPSLTADDTTTDPGTISSSGDTAEEMPTVHPLRVDVDGMLGERLVLLNRGEDPLTIDTNGTHTFRLEMPTDALYDVRIAYMPIWPPQRCTVVDGIGTAGPGVAPVEVACDATYHVAFLTSTEGTGDLSSWDDAGGATGTAAGDAICQAHADRAGFSGTFVAWLSDSTSDAYCRVAGLTGKRASDCGKDASPTGAGPWVRPDAAAFASTLERMVPPTSEVFAPIILDDQGNNQGLDGVFSGSFFSGTTTSGEAGLEAENRCADWTDTRTGVFGTGGVANNVNLYVWNGTCNYGRHLLCLQTGAGIDPPDPPPPPPDAHRMFVSSTMVHGDFGGLAGGDAHCQGAATKAGFEGTYRAWLATSDTGALSRLSHTGPWIRSDGRVIADDTKALLANRWEAPRM